MSNEFHRSIMKLSPLKLEDDEDNEDKLIHKEEDLFQDFIFEKKATNDKAFSSIPLRIFGYNAFRIITILILSILLLILIAFILLYYGVKDIIKLFLCFDFKKKGNMHFVSDSNAFLICLIIIILNIICIINFMTKNNTIKIYPYLNDMSFGLPLSLIFLSIRLCLGAFVDFNFWFYIVHLGLAISSIGLIIVLYIKKKRKKYNRVVSIINESFFLSLLLGLYCYELLYSIFNLIKFYSDYISFSIDIYVGIGLNLVFFCVALCLLTLFKDIVFTLFLGIIEIGLLMQKTNNNIFETISSMIILLFLFGSSVILIFKYKTKIFGYVEQENVNTVVYDTDKITAI